MKEEIIVPFEDILTSIFSEEMGPIHLLYRLSDMDEEQLAQFLTQWQSAPDDRRQVIVRHLADISEENFVVDFSPIFRISFEDPNALVRIAALDGLWDSTDSTLVEPILRLLNSDPALEVRVAAAKASAHFLLLAEWDQIRDINSPQIIKSLYETYVDPMTELSLKCAVLEAMGPATSPTVSRLIEDAYEGFVPELQLSAVFAMGTSADPRWISIILDEMESPNEEMRAEAARAAGLIGLNQAIPQLAELAYDDDLDVAIVAVTSIAQIGGDEADNILNALLGDPRSDHLHKAIEDAMEESIWLDGELPLFPWSEDDLDEDLEIENLD